MWIAVYRRVSIHAPRAGRDSPSTAMRATAMRFNPRAPCGARPYGRQPILETACFNPRAPCGARQRRVTVRIHILTFQSTRPVRGATAIERVQNCAADVSIHAPRAGRDRASRALPKPYPCFNPRAPCGARRINRKDGDMHIKFQSTRPVRGATRPSSPFPLAVPFQSTRPVRGATRGCGSSACPQEFQSTRPVRGATSDSCRVRRRSCVSIHAPRAGRDIVKVQLADEVRVSIHAPRAGRDDG